MKLNIRNILISLFTLSCMIILSCQSWADINTDDIPIEEATISSSPQDILPTENPKLIDPVLELGLVQKEVQNTQTLSPIAEVKNANQKSLQEPNTNVIQNSLVVYNYSQNFMYRVYTSPQRVTVIKLKKGEEVIGELVAGDTANWIIARAEDKERSIIYIKPTRELMSTNLVINTNQRSYYLVLRSLEETYMVSVEWRYPQDTINTTKRKNALEIPISIDRLYFGYKILARSKHIDWTPIKVFDDGTKTFIQFKDKLNIPETPVLFTIEKNNASLINYRIIDDYFVVDRILYNAELRVGNKKKDAIKIVRMKQRIR